jgi:uncharacterized lipoprotein NlpE involved in copper resistance
MSPLLADDSSTPPADSPGIELSADILQPLIQAVVLVLVALAVYGLKKLSTWIATKTDSERIKQITGAVRTAAIIGVREAGQTFADEAKARAADGKLSITDARIAASRAFDRAMQILKEQGIQATPNFVRGAIEAAVDERKELRGKAPAPVAGS